jgi:hypothetical protein
MAAAFIVFVLQTGRGGSGLMSIKRGDEGLAGLRGEIHGTLFFEIVCELPHKGTFHVRSFIHAGAGAY